MPGAEILLCRTRTDVCTRWIFQPELKRIADAARERTLAEHTADRRVNDLESILEDTYVGHHSGSGQGKPDPPLAFSKELLPVGSRYDGHTERP